MAKETGGLPLTQKIFFIAAQLPKNALRRLQTLRRFLPTAMPSRKNEISLPIFPPECELPGKLVAE
jgi:hypothetical protein